MSARQCWWSRTRTPSPPCCSTISRRKATGTTLAADGEEALLIVDERSPDLVVLDWMLPKVSGIEVCRRLRGRAQDPQPADPRC